MFKTIFISCLLILINLFLGNALECYVCDQQEANSEKCLKTIKTCEYGEDVCLTEIGWGSTPYWQQGALKQFYISKSCSNKTACESYRKSLMPLCTRIWYEDWRCSECCKGDRCNYYIISEASKKFPLTTLTIFTLILSTVVINFN